MAVNLADLSKAINTAWDASTLDTTFEAYWSVDSGEFYVLNDEMAPEGQPWPYVVMDQPNQTVVSRSSSTTDNSKREIRDIEVRFNIFAQRNPGSSLDPKQHAEQLAEEIMKVFGGHPSTSPTATITLDNGNHLITRYQNDFGIMISDDEYQWVLVYLFRVDVPVAI